MNRPPSAGHDDLTALRLLQEIEENPSISQREISRRVGVSLGLTNLLIRRMARQAWIKIRSVPGRRLLYAITPKGMAEKVRRMREFVRLLLCYHSELRRSLVQRIRAAGSATPCVASVGAGDLGRIVAEAVREAGGRYVGQLEEAGASGKLDVLVLLEKVTPAQRDGWARAGMAFIDLS